MFVGDVPPGQEEPMLHKSLVVAIRKAGLTLQEHKPFENGTVQYFVRANGRILSWWPNKHDSGVVEVSGLNSRREGDEDDFQTDYFAGHNPRTIRRAIAGLTGTETSRTPPTITTRLDANGVPSPF
jgi:hypothetical protein